MEGIVQSEDSAHVKLQIGIGTVTLNKSQVDHIYRSTVPESAAITAGWEENKRRDEALEKESQALEKSRAVQMELQPKETKISGKDGSLFVKVLLNKKVPATLVLDTGAQTVLLTKAIAKKLGLSLKTAPHVMGQLADGRKVPATRVNLDSVQVDQSEIKNVEADVFLEEKSELTQDGLLGMSFLKHFTFRVDYKHNRLVLEKLK